MRKLLEEVGPPVAVVGLLNFFVWNRPFTLITILSVVIGTLAWLFFRPLITVIVKNIRKEHYHG